MKIYIAGKITGEQKAEAVKEFGYTEQEINSVWKGNLKIGIGDGRTLLGLPGIQRKREESEGTSLRTGS